MRAILEAWWPGVLIVFAFCVCIAVVGVFEAAERERRRPGRCSCPAHVRERFREHG